MNTNLYAVHLVLEVEGKPFHSEFTCADIKVGERFISFEMEPTTTTDGFNADTVNTKNFPYERVIQFDVKKEKSNDEA